MPQGIGLYIPYLEALPHDDLFWRIDWYGNVFFDRAHRYKSPFIKVSISQVIPDENEQWSYPSSLLIQIIQKQVVLPVGILSVLPLGSIWKNGKQVIQPSYSEAIFSIDGRRDHFQLLKAGSEMESGFLIPFEYHPYHKDHTHSYCLTTKTDCGVELVFPAVEVCRFYFGNTSSMFTRMHLAPFEPKRFWEKASVNKLRHAKLDIANGLSGRAAPDIARIAFHPAALYAAKVYANSVLTSHTNDIKIYPKMQFPLSKKTNIKVNGVWIDKRFLVLQIQSCSHPLPFSKLSYTLQRKQALITENDNQATKDDVFVKASNKDSVDSKITNDPPGADAITKPKLLGQNVRFPDLVHKKINRGDPEAPTKILYDAEGGQANELGVGSPEGKSKTKLGDLVASDSVEYPNLDGAINENGFVDYVKEYVEKLTRDGYEVKFLPLSKRQRYPQFSLMPELIDENGEIHPLSLIETKVGFRVRYVSVMKVFKRDRKECYIVFEKFTVNM